MAAGIFISYRRSDMPHAAGRLADDLGYAFGTANIFRDIEGIDPGVNFVQSLERALGECVVMLVLIGPRWLATRDEQGRSRLDHSGDWIRQEVATALARDDVRVIPVLIEGAGLPAADELPEDMRALVDRQAFEMADARWHGDLQRLVDALARVPGLQRTAAPAAPGANTASVRPRGASAATPAASPAPSTGMPRLLWAGAGAVAAAVLAATFWPLDDAAEEATPAATAAAAAPAPAASAAPALATAVQSVSDVSGLWHSDIGEIYRIEQDGAALRFTVEDEGERLGGGSGEIDGARMHARLTVEGDTYVCNLIGASDLSTFAGPCEGPDGVESMHIFR